MPKLIILRHGESAWNSENRFTGWVDVDLTDTGVKEARTAGERIGADPELAIDVVHTSVLTRAVRTANIALEACGKSFVPVRRHWRLNERHYGAITGLNKKETAEKYGEEQVHIWRRSFDVRPAPLDISSEYHPINDPRYAGIPVRALPATECLEDVIARLIPYFEDAIAADLLAGKNTLVVAHGNSLRALMKYVENISDEGIMDVEIATGLPRVYDLDDKLNMLSVRYLN